MLKLLILNIFLYLHPVHVTLTTINQAQNSDTLKVFCRMYYDDFQLDYKLFYPEFKPGISNDTMYYSHEMLNKYFQGRVQIYINSKLLSGRLSDVTINDYEILLNFKYHSVRKPRNFRIRNQIMTSIYSDQANMVYLNINKYEDAIKLTVEKVEAGIRLK
jgi:hypothetical protein